MFSPTRTEHLLPSILIRINRRRPFVCRAGLNAGHSEFDPVTFTNCMNTDSAMPFPKVLDGGAAGNDFTRAYVALAVVPTHIEDGQHVASTAHMPCVGDTLAIDARGSLPLELLLTEGTDLVRRLCWTHYRHDSVFNTSNEHAKDRSRPSRCRHQTVRRALILSCAYLPVARPSSLSHTRRILQIPRGREVAGSRDQGIRRRRNRPPETLRQKGRAGKGPLESPLPKGGGTDGVRRGQPPAESLRSSDRGGPRN